MYIYSTLLSSFKFATGIMQNIPFYCSKFYGKYNDKNTL